MHPAGMYMQKEVTVDDPGRFASVFHFAGQDVKNFASERTLLPGLIIILPSAPLYILYQVRLRGAGPDSTSPF